MKKIHYLLMTAVAALVAFTACQKEPEQQTDPNAFGKFKLSEIVDAASTAYKAWEESEAFPESFTLGDKTATIAQYQNAICQALVNISAGKTDDITVITVKPADHPERDSYDKETIAIANGPKNGDETEDLVNVAKRMIERMTKELKVPNQTNFTRNGSAIAFSTDRATIVISRALANYKKDGKLGESIDAGYKGASNTLKAFAKELVKYLDIWEKTVGTVDADGSHCTSNNTAWENVHFIPIEYSGGYKDGTMYSEYYQPYYHVKVDNKEYTSAECWSIAAQGIMDLVTLEGSSLMQPTRNPFIHTLGNGKTLDEPIPTPAEYVITTGWGKWPWYENTNDGGKVINFSESNPCTVEFLAHELGWYLTRCTTLDPPAIGNFQEFGTSESTINFNGYVGQISAMRTFLIMIRFYDYLLKNNITENVWDAVKDVHLNYDLYGVDMPDIELVTSKLEFDCVEGTKEAKFSAKKAWTATATESWITVEPSSGEAGDITLKITCAANSGDAREGKVIVKGGNVTDGLEIVVKQVKYTEPSTATIKEFAQEYIKIIDEWATHVGTINRLSDWELAKEGDKDIVENAHYVPNGYTIVVGGKTYTTGDMLELALRSYLLLRGWDGNETEKAGWGNFPEVTPVDINAPLPKAHDFKFGSPLIETSNGGYLYKQVNGQEVYGQVDPVILDNWAQRALNWPFTHDKVHSNLCGYPRDPITNYGGCFSSGRALLTYAFFFKYMLDNGLQKADNLGADVVIRSELFGLETAKTPTLKDFAKEFVKGLEVWENTVGTVESESDHLIEKGAAWENVHFIPIVPNPNCEYLSHAGNQYDPKWASKIWKLKVEGTEYSSSQAWEIAIRGLMNMCTAEGEAFLEGMTDRNKAYTVQDGLALSKAPISEPSKDNQWGKHPWYEDGSLVKDGGKEISEVGIDFMLKVGAWHVVRSFIPAGSNKPLGMIGNFQEFGTSSGSLNLKGDNGDYVGLISPMRELLVMMRIYKYLLDNNIDSNVYSAIKDKKFDFDLYGESPAPAASIKIDGDLSDWDAIEGTSNGTFGSFKAASDDKNLYFYCYRTTEQRYSDIWGGTGYIYVGFELDDNPANNTAKLWASEAYDLLLLIYPYGGSKDAPAITEAAGTAGGCEPAPCTVANVVCKGVVDQSGAKIEFSIPRADVSNIPASPIKITAWGNKDLAKVELNCTL